MKIRRSRVKLALLLVAFAFVGVYFWNPVRQAFGVAALQNGAGATVYLGSQGRPERLPAFLDNTFLKLIDRFCPASMKSRADDYHERFRSMFRDPIDIISLPLPFKGDPGVALSRFPHLRRLIVCGYDTKTCTEMEWDRLCAGLQACANLQEIELHGEQITDGNIARLAKHPTLRSVTVYRAALTPACVGTLATLPRLAELRVSNFAQPAEIAALSPADLPAMSAALPKVKIVIEPLVGTVRPEPERVRPLWLRR